MDHICDVQAKGVFYTYWYDKHNVLPWTQWTSHMGVAKLC